MTKLIFENILPKIVDKSRQWKGKVIRYKPFRNFRLEQIEQKLKSNDHIIKVPSSLIFLHERPIVCTHIYDLYNHNFNRTARKNYMKWFDRTKSLDKNFWARPRLYPGKDAIIKLRRIVLLSRLKLFLTYRLSSIKEPFEVKKFEKDNFSLVDGHHRCSILISSGAKHILLSCDEEVWKRWNDREKRVFEVANKYYEFRKNIMKKIPYQPIETIFPGYVYSRNAEDRIGTAFRAISREDVDVLDIGCNIGFFSRCLARMRKNVTAIDREKDHINTAKEITKACEDLKVDFQNILFQDIPLDKSYDVLLDFSALWHLIYSHKTISENDFVQRISRICRNKLISECDNKYFEQYRTLITSKTKLKYYTKLGNTPFFDQVREIGVYSTEPWFDHNGEYDFDKWGKEEKELWRRRVEKVTSI